MFETISNALSTWGPLAVFYRLLLATLVGIAIGAERERHSKDAGMKTHVLVCVGSALCMIVSQYIEMESMPGSLDTSRIGSSVVSGVGFLGVGTIIVTGNHEVRGLTTAAGLWACACLGLAAGVGFLEGTLLALAFVLFTFVILRRIDKFMNLANREFDLYAELDSNRNVKHLLHRMREFGANYENVRLKKATVEDDGPIVTMHIKMDSSNNRTRDDVIAMVDDLDYVYYVEDL
ncbi:MAG: MgtC/SapB family protein [Coriobacteriales bacterium]|nr:MgtC/SapB family protein [Coriobacteriales bacterium]